MIECALLRNDLADRRRRIDERDVIVRELASHSGGRRWGWGWRDDEWPDRAGYVKIKPLLQSRTAMTKYLSLQFRENRCPHSIKPLVAFRCGFVISDISGHCIQHSFCCSLVYHTHIASHQYVFESELSKYFVLQNFYNTLVQDIQTAFRPYEFASALSKRHFV